MLFAVRLVELSVIEGLDLTRASNVEIVALLRESFDFLPKETKIELKEGIVTIDIPDSTIQDKSEADRLHSKATQRAKQGDYRKAVGIWERVIELDPANVEARRNLGMAYIELQETDKAREHLVEAAVLDPKDAWSFVVLGNILAKENDWGGAERFIKQALVLKPEDGWALNSLGAICTERHEYEDAIAWFEKSIRFNPKFANPYFGRAHALIGIGKPEAALASIEELFQKAERQDIRSESVFRGARESYWETAKVFAKINKENADKALVVYQEHIEDLSGFPVREERQDLAAMIAGQTQMAWKKNRDHHLMLIRRAYPEPLWQHIKAHELTHIALEAEARALGRNKWFSTTAATRELAIRSMASDIKKLERKGLNSKRTAEVMVELLAGVCGFVFNAPLDMMIEQRIRERLPDLRYNQLCSLIQMAKEAESVSTNKDVRELTPNRILRVNDALNGAMALWLSDFSGGIGDFVQSYRKFEAFPIAQKIYQHFQTRSKGEFKPGDEYRLVDDIAEMLGIRDWYQWIADPGVVSEAVRSQTITTDGQPQGTTNPELLRTKDMASTMYLLAALERFDKLPAAKVKQIALEIAVLGMSGLDYASSEKKYSLNAIPGEEFSGLELMCLMHAGLRQSEPDVNTGMDLDGPLTAAKKLHLDRRGKAK